MTDLAVKGENNSCTILFLSSLDWMSLKAISQSPVKPTYAKELSATASLQNGAR